MLEQKLERIADIVACQIVGTCDSIDEHYFLDTFGINFDQISEILTDREVEQCVICSWWIGDAAWSTNFGEIVCYECLEDEN